MSESRSMSRRQARWILVLLIAASTFGFSFLADRKHACFNWESPDAASIGYGFFHTFDGKFFPYYAREGSLLGEHADFILLAWLPIFKLAPSMLSLFFFQSLMISLAAWPAYRLARSQHCDRPTALIAAAGLLMLPPVAGQHVNQIHEDQFALVFLLFALFFFKDKNFLGFCLSAILATLAKETIALSVVMFGIYAAVRRREWRWIATPVFWGCGYLAAMLIWLMPSWGTWGKTLYGHMAYFSGYGHTPAEVLRYFALNPASSVEAILAPDRIRYLVLLLTPLLLIGPFRSWAWILAAPPLLINLLSTNRLLRDLTWHYSIVAGTLLWASFVIGLPQWVGSLEVRLRPRNYRRILSAASLVLSIALIPVWFSIWQYRPASSHQARLEAVSAIPVDAKVICPDNMLAHFVNRPALQSLGGLRFHRRDINELFDFDYIVFDANFGSPDWDIQSQVFDFISKHPQYRLVLSRDKVFVFHRTGTPSRTLRW